MNDQQLQQTSDSAKKRKRDSLDDEWLEEEDEVLRTQILVKKLNNWEKVAEGVPTKLPWQCKRRWMEVLRPSSQFEITERRKWVEEEDRQLTELVKKYGTKNWRIIASHLVGRLPKQCRERWINHVDPEIEKGRLTDSDWLLVLNAQKEHGNRWSEIAKQLPGRTPNQIKNHWHAMMRKRANQRRRDGYDFDIYDGHDEFDDDLRSHDERTPFDFLCEIAECCYLECFASEPGTTGDLQYCQYNKSPLENSSPSVDSPETFFF